MEDIDNASLTTENGLMQVKPETSRDEQLAFIDTLRNIQSQQNQEIQDATHALGTDTTPRYGGLNGTNSYWLNRYQTPQTEARLANLRTAAQSSALNTALNNYLTRLQEDYNTAYRKASKRSRSSSGTGGNTTTTTIPEGEGETEITSVSGNSVVEDAFTKRAKQDALYEAIKAKQQVKENLSKVLGSPNITPSLTGGTKNAQQTAKDFWKNIRNVNGVTGASLKR